MLFKVFIFLQVISCAYAAIPRTCSSTTISAPSEACPCDLATKECYCSPIHASPTIGTSCTEMTDACYCNPNCGCVSHIDVTTDTATETIIKYNYNLFKVPYNYISDDDCSRWDCSDPHAYPETEDNADPFMHTCCTSECYARKDTSFNRTYSTEDRCKDFEFKIGKASGANTYDEKVGNQTGSACVSMCIEHYPKFNGVTFSDTDAGGCWCVEDLTETDGDATESNYKSCMLNLPDTCRFM